VAEVVFSELLDQALKVSVPQMRDNLSESPLMVIEVVRKKEGVIISIIQ